MRPDLIPSSWVDEMFNPWLDEYEPPSAERLAPPWRGTSLRTLGADVHALKWNDQAEVFAASHGGRRRRVFAGPWCTVLGGTPNGGKRARFWDLVCRTPWIDWLILADDGFADEKWLPPDWGRGYENVWVGAALTSMGTAGAVLASLRGIPAKLRFVLAQPNRHDLGDLDLRGVGWVVISIGVGDRIEDPDSVASVKLQAMYQGVPVWFDRQDLGSRSKWSSQGVFEVQESPRLGL